MMSKKWYANFYILLMIIVSGTAVAMAGLMFLLLPQSGEIINLMQWRLAKARSFHLSFAVSYAGQVEIRDAAGGVRKNDEAVAVTGSGTVDRTDPDEIKIGQDFSLTVGAGKTAPDATGEFRRIGRADFVNFSVLPATWGALQFEAYRDQWLTFDLERLRGRLNVPFFGGEGQALTAADGQYLLDQFRQTPFLRFLGRLKPETVNNAPTYHYAVRPEAIFIKHYLIQTEQLRLGRDLTTAESQAVDSFFGGLSADDGEIWIGKKDYYPRRLKVRFHFDDNISRRGVFELTVDFFDFNAATAPGAPPANGIRNIDDILASLLPSVAEHLPLAGPGAFRQLAPGEATGRGLPVTAPAISQTDADHDGLSDSLEAFYGTDPHDPDTDGDGLKDGYEVEHGLNPRGPGKLFDFGLTSGGN